MSIFKVVIKGQKSDAKTDDVLNNLAKLFKTTPERIRPHLMSKNLIVKNSTDIETAKKYKKALENIGCIVEIESELSFDIPEIVPVQSSNKNKTTIENTIIANESVKDNTLSQLDLKDKTVHRFFVKKFDLFDAEDNEFKPTFNGYALFFNIIWYYYKGLWGKAGFMLSIFLLFNKSSPWTALILAIYCCIAGNYDYYLLKTKNTQLWVKNRVPRGLLLLTIFFILIFSTGKPFSPFIDY